MIVTDRETEIKKRRLHSPETRIPENSSASVNKRGELLDLKPKTTGKRSN